jgi:tetratricopeptide (TPR) repeat protein
MAPIYLSSLGVVSGALEAQGRLAEAYTDCQEALKSCRLVRVSDLRDYRPLQELEIRLLDQLADIEAAQKNHQQAAAHFREILALRRKTFEQERCPSDIVASMFRTILGGKNNWQGNYDPQSFCAYAETQVKLAKLLIKMGRRYEAECQLGEVMITLSVIANYPRLGLRYEVALANAYAVAVPLCDDWQNSQSSLLRDAAVAIWQRLLAESEENAEYRSGVHGHQDDLAWFRTEFGDPAKLPPVQPITERGPGTGPGVIGVGGLPHLAWRASEVSLINIGDYENGLNAFTKLAELRGRNKAFDWLYVAVVHAYQEKPGLAQTWYDKSVKDIEATGQPLDEIDEQFETTRRLIEEKRQTAPPPEIVIADASTPESAAAVLTVTLSDACDTPVTVEYSTADKTAHADLDYERTGGILRFAAGEISRSISVPAINDAEFEKEETFVVALTNASAGVMIRDGLATATIARSDMPQVGMVSQWTADNTADDASGANDATLINGATYAAGQIGQAFSFDGVDDRVQVRDGASLALTESMTIEGWVRVATFPANRNHGQILFRGDDRGGLDPYALSVSQAGSLVFRIHGGANEAVSIDSPIPLDQFMHVAATLDDATGVMRLYLNGALVSEKVTAIRPFEKLKAANNPGIGIGNHGGHPGSFHNFPFHGLIDELKLYDKALTAEEVQNSFRAGQSRRPRVAESPKPL